MHQVRAFVAANALALATAAAIVVAGVVGGVAFGMLLAARHGPVAEIMLAPDPTVRPVVTPTPS